MSETQVTSDTQVDVTDDLDAFSSELFGESKEPKQDAKPEAEQEEPEVEDAGDNEAQDTDLDEDEELEEPEEKAPPAKKTVQDRINELVAKNYETERAAEARLAELRKEFEDKLAALQPKAPEKKAAAEPDPTDQLEDGTDKYPLGEFDPAYIRDLTRFTLEQERTQVKIKDEQERQQREIAQQEQALVSSWQEKVAPAKERYPDFENKGQELIDGFANLDQGYAQYLTSLLMSMDAGPDVLYYLASNRDEAVKIVNSGAQKATLALGRIEAKFVEAEQAKQSAKPKISKAPPPPAVNARGTGGGVKVIEPDTDDLDAFTSEFFKKTRKRF